MTQFEGLRESSDWRADNLDYFLARPEDAEKRQEYIHRGLVPTNNLSLYIVDNPAPEWVPGIKNPFDYNQLPFGPMIVRLHTEYPELWERAKEVESKRRDDIKGLISRMADNTSTEGPALTAGLAPGEWEKAEVYAQVMEVLAPWLIEANIAPLELCI